MEEAKDIGEKAEIVEVVDWGENKGKTPKQMVEKSQDSLENICQLTKKRREIRKRHYGKCGKYEERKNSLKRTK